jgi:DNA-binding transcriptional regulator YiaG
MPNIANLLKSEIARVARKQVRAETQGIKQAIAPYRAQIADLKRRTRELELQVNRLGRVAAKAAAANGAAGAGAESAEQRNLRFSAKGLAAQRRRLGLSAQAFGALIGASGQSVYKWEEGKTRPRAKHLPAIASLRTIGKKEAAARLESLAR